MKDFPNKPIFDQTPISAKKRGGISRGGGIKVISTVIRISKNFAQNFKGFGQNLVSEGFGHNLTDFGQILDCGKMI